MVSSKIINLNSETIDIYFLDFKQKPLTSNFTWYTGKITTRCAIKLYHTLTMHQTLYTSKLKLILIHSKKNQGTILTYG